MRASTLIELTTYLLLISAAPAYSGIGTTVPISAELGTSIAGDNFPLTVKIGKGSLFLTDPTVLFIDDKRIGMQVRIAVDVNVPLGARRVGGNAEQRHPGPGGDVALFSFENVAVSRRVEQGRHP